MRKRVLEQKQDKQSWKWFMERVRHSALTWNKSTNSLLVLLLVQFSLYTRRHVKQCSFIHSILILFIAGAGASPKILGKRWVTLWTGHNLSQG